MAENRSVPVFDLFSRQWGLATAGTLDHFNTCTIAWGTLGTIWGRSVCTVFINELRYTNEFMRDNEYFTVSFFPESYREDLELLGRESGRDGDKVARTKLTPVSHGNCVIFKEACLTYVCRKIYWDRMSVDQMLDPGVRDGMYQKMPPHDEYIGEIVEVIEA